jgi:hypothetical protein
MKMDDDLVPRALGFCPRPTSPIQPRRPSAPASACGMTAGSWCLLRPDPRAAPRPTEECRPGRRPAPTRSPGLPRGARQPSGSQRRRHAAVKPDAADPAALCAASVPVVPTAGARRVLATSGDRNLAIDSTLPRPGACTVGSRLWLPSLRLAFQKGHLAAKTCGRNWVRTQ